MTATDFGTLPDGREFARPEPDWWVDDETIYGPDGFSAPLELAVPGRANRGNATQAVAAARARVAAAQASALAMKVGPCISAAFGSSDQKASNTLRVAMVPKNSTA